MNLFKNNKEVLNYIEKILRVEGVPGTLMLALPLAYISGSFLNLFFLWKLFRKDFLQGVSSGLKKIFFQSLASSSVIGGVTYLLLAIFDDVFKVDTFWGILAQGFFAGVFGILCGVFVLYLMKNKELAGLSLPIRHKFWKSKIVAPEQKEL